MIDSNIVQGKKYLISYGFTTYKVRAAEVSECGNYMRCRFGPWLIKGEWVHKNHVVATI